MGKQLDNIATNVLKYSGETNWGKGYVVIDKRTAHISHIMVNKKYALQLAKKWKVNKEDKKHILVKEVFGTTIDKE